jgi:hypothetical protein
MGPGWLIPGVLASGGFTPSTARSPLDRSPSPSHTPQVPLGVFFWMRRKVRCVGVPTRGRIRRLRRMRTYRKLLYLTSRLASGAVAKR